MSLRPAATWAVRHVSRHALLALIGLTLHGADMAAQQRDTTLHATVFGWSERTWLHLLDRGGLKTGRLGDDGMLGWFSPIIDDEYELDRISIASTLTDEFEWQRREGGVRYWAGSINHRDLISGLEARGAVGLGNGWKVRFRFDKEDTPTLARNLPRFGLEKRWTSGLVGTIGATFDPDKPSMDVTAGAGFRSTQGAANVSVTLLDAFSDIIYQGLVVSPGFADTAVDYDAPPLAVRANAQQQIGRHVRVEVDGAWSPEVTFRAYRQVAPDSGLRQTEDFAAVAALAEWTTVRTFRAGLATTWVRTSFARSPLPLGRPEDDFELVESRLRVGGFVLADPLPFLRMEGWVLRDVREYGKVYRQGAAANIDYADRSWMGQTSIRYLAPFGLTGSTALEFDLRRADRGEGQLPGQSKDRQGTRLKLQVGWRFHGRLWIEAGYRIDLDGDGHTHGDWYDGAHGRGAIYW